MICRKIYQKNLRSFSQWLRFVSSATVPPSSVAGNAARIASFEMGSLSGPQFNISANPRTLFFLKNRNEGNAVSLCLFIRLKVPFPLWDSFLATNGSCACCILVECNRKNGILSF